ncbi:MAG: condensation domain-containing protein [Cohaesibacter sp.]|nr:condensation domain-containing protein [Cohaesibacter sp.]
MTLATTQKMAATSDESSISSYLPSSEISVNQEQICLLEAFYPGTKAYNAQAIIQWTGIFDTALFEKAINDVISRHEILRTTIDLGPRGYTATVHPSFNFKAGFHDLSDVPEPQQEEIFAELKQECMRHSFNLKSLPLLDIRVAQLSQDKWRIIHIEHHVIHDGWSFGLFWNELLETYNALKDGRQPNISPPPVQYQQFVAWQRARIRGEYGRNAIAFWQDYLSGITMETSASTRQMTEASLKGRNFELNISPETYGAVVSTAKRLKVSEFVVMFSVFSMVLSQATGAEDFAIGTAVSARTETEIEPMIGMVVNTTPIRVKVAPNTDLRSVCRYIQTSLFRALRFQDLPLSSLVRELGLIQKKGKNPIFQHCFSFHDSYVPKIELKGAKGYIEEIQNQTAKFDINVVTIPANAERGTVNTRMFWQFSDGLFDHEDCCALIKTFLNLLDTISDTA